MVHFCQYILWTYFGNSYYIYEYFILQSRKKKSLDLYSVLLYGENSALLKDL